MIMLMKKAASKVSNKIKRTSANVSLDILFRTGNPRWIAEKVFPLLRESMGDIAFKTKLTNFLFAMNGRVYNEAYSYYSATTAFMLNEMRRYGQNAGGGGN